METQPLRSHSKKRLDPKLVLEKALEERCRKNASYSLRSFSRSSGISHTVLSLILSGKRKMSKKAALKLASFLQMDPAECDALMHSYSEHPGQEFTTLSIESFEVISDWYHYAILSALELPEAKLESRWMAKRLRIQPLEAALAIKRLKVLNLVKFDEKIKRWVQSGLPIKIDNALSTSATKKFHKQLLLKAAESIDSDPKAVRDMTSVTFAMDASLIGYASKKIRDFRLNLMADLESKGSPCDVYNMTIQLFPVTTPHLEIKK